MYRDKDKQRATTRERVRKWRNAHRESVTPEPMDVTPCVTPNVTPIQDVVPDPDIYPERKPSKWERYVVRR